MTHPGCDRHDSGAIIYCDDNVNVKTGPPYQSFGKCCVHAFVTSSYHGWSLETVFKKKLLKLVDTRIFDVETIHNLSKFLKGEHDLW